MLTPKYDLAGQKFGKLTALHFESSPGNHKGIDHAKRGGLWVCACECGATRKNRSGDLRSGRIVSCGCQRASRNSLTFRKSDEDLVRSRTPKTSRKRRAYDHVATKQNSFLRNYKGSARRRGYTVELSDEQLLALTQQDCFYCAAKPKGDVWSHNGIDRQDNALGYTAENSVPCCSLCNRNKGVLSSEFFFLHCSDVYHNMGSFQMEAR